MPRSPDDPSGPTRTVCISLSPDRLERLDALAETRSLSRSALLGKLIDRVTIGVDDQPVAVTAAGVDALCSHTKPTVIGGGLKRCGDCGATTNMKGVWYTP